MKFDEAYKLALEAPISEKFEQLTGTLVALRCSVGLTSTERERIKEEVARYTDLALTAQRRYRNRKRSLSR